MRRAAGGKKIAHADDQRIRLRVCGGEKFRQILGEMLAVRVHRDRVREPEFSRALKTCAQRRAFAGIFFQPDNFAARQFWQRHAFEPSSTTMHRAKLLRRARDGGDRAG